MDKEITRLLKRKQNRKLTDKEKVRLQELIDTRDAIEIKYHLSSADAEGFDTIRRKVEAEVARAEASGQEVSTSVYESALVAAGEGMGAVNRSLDEQYEKEYSLIQLIQDETERQQSSVSLSGNTFYIRDDKDVQALAIEIASLTKRKQAGRGVRLA